LGFKEYEEESAFKENDGERNYPSILYGFSTWVMN
jgi:hypothetical protein